LEGASNIDRPYCYDNDSILPKLVSIKKGDFDNDAGQTHPAISVLSCGTKADAPTYSVLLNIVFVDAEFDW